MSTKLVWITENAEQIISYCARVSNPKNQTNTETAPKLLEYCIKHKHWSIFEMANMCVEIKTSRAISAQLLRHRSMVFQEFSLRYQSVRKDSYIKTKPRRQDSKNRQNSIDDLSQEIHDWFEEKQSTLWNLSIKAYEDALEKGIAKECARMLLPLSTETTLYCSGNIRSWITYLQVRCDQSTQLEHRIMAEEIKEIFKTNLPIISQALGWL